MILDKIKKPNDIHKIPLAEFPQLAEEIRSFLIESVRPCALCTVMA